MLMKHDKSWKTHYAFVLTVSKCQPVYISSAVSSGRPVLHCSKDVSTAYWRWLYCARSLAVVKEAKNLLCSVWNLSWVSVTAAKEPATLSSTNKPTAHFEDPGSTLSSGLSSWFMKFHHLGRQVILTDIVMMFSVPPGKFRGSNLERPWFLSPTFLLDHLHEPLVIS
jgi:hypothetical protein